MNLGRQLVTSAFGGFPHICEHLETIGIVSCLGQTPHVSG